jgi:hypothetical protein
MGANITFTANLFHHGVEPAKGTFKWKDNVNSQHQYEVNLIEIDMSFCEKKKTNTIDENRIQFTSTDSQSTWVVSYPPDEFLPGWYQVQVEVFSTFIIDWSECSKRASFKLTST